MTVTGAGGFIGAHLVRYLKRRGHRVRGIDLHPPAFGLSAADEFLELDLRDADQARAALAGSDTVFALAANMGGIGWTHAAPAEIIHDNLLISLQTLDGCRAAGVSRLVYSSSACVYPMYLQTSPDSAPLCEHRVFPADPDESYGWEKLTSELLFQTWAQPAGMEVRIARLHAIYGPDGHHDGERAKSLLALCGKVARIEGDEGVIDVWGDGSQSRSYCYVDDCVEGLWRIADSDVREPLNMGSQESVTIADLVARIAQIAGKTVHCEFDLNRPVGPLGRNCDNTLIRERLGWAPATALDVGLRCTYEWVAADVRRDRATAAAPGPDAAEGGRR
jgi:nucleoside-diphosphate-sugar epimerase